MLDSSQELARMSTSAQTAMDLRIQWLEFVLSGSTSSINPDATNDANETDAIEQPEHQAKFTSEHAAGVQRRTVELEDKLRNTLAASGHDGLKRFAASYESYASLVFPPNLSFASSSIDPTDNTRPPPPKSIESSLLPYQSKVDLIDSASLDLVELERGLREVEILVQRGAAGSGDLAAYQSLLPRLRAAQAQHARNLVAQNAKQRAVSNVLGRYNEYVMTMSKLFVGLHQQVEELENAVGREEKRRADEAKERY